MITTPSSNRLAKANYTTKNKNQPIDFPNILYLFYHLLSSRSARFSASAGAEL
jgi:hypothetical protein